MKGQPGNRAAVLSGPNSMKRSRPGHFVTQTVYRNVDCRSAILGNQKTKLLPKLPGKLHGICGAALESLDIAAKQRFKATG
jgi:hypothetical protein